MLLIEFVVFSLLDSITPYLNLLIFKFFLFLVVDDRGRRSSGRREDPRRHTLGGDMLHYGSQGGNLQRSMDLEVSREFFL